MPPPTKNRSVPDRCSGQSQRSAEGTCPCVAHPNSSGICELDVWYGTTVDVDAAQSSRRLLRPNLPVIKRKQWELDAFSVRLYNLVALGWVPLLSVFVGVYVAVVGLFALLLGACHEMNQENAQNARDLFNLSLQTLSTVGFGTLHPRNTCANWIAVVESFLSMLLTAFMTGIFFVKFARPHPNVAFSDIFTVSQGEGGLRESRFRVANNTCRDLAHKGDILDVSFKLIMMRVETGRHGEKILCYYDLELETAHLISLRLEIELVHIINTNSPLFSQTCEEVARSDFVLVLIASGLDENLHDTVHQRQEYDHESMKWGAKFLPVLGWDTDHKHVELDLDKISCFEVGRVVDVDTMNSPVQGEDVGTLRAPSSDERGGNRVEQRNSGHTEAEESRHRLTDGNHWELSDEYDQEAILRKTCGQSEKEESSTSSRQLRAYEMNQRSSHPALSHLEHDHNLGYDTDKRPRSLLQRRVRVKSRSHRFLSNGMYHRALGTSWPILLMSLAAVYISVVAAIALLISISIHNPLDQDTDVGFAFKFEEVFFFCVQTVSTVGYGKLSPRKDSDAVNFFVFLLVFAGIVISTLFTGITWSKFSIPNSSAVLYSDTLLLTTFHSHRALMFRAANNRRFGVLVDGTFRMNVVLLDRTFGRKDTHELQLVRNVWPIIRLCNTVTHIIDESSPLYHSTTEELLSGDNFFVVLFTGLDNITSDTLVARKAYHACDILIDHHFVDNIRLTADGLYIDLDAINTTFVVPNPVKNEAEDSSKCSSSRSSIGTKSAFMETSTPPNDEFAAVGTPRSNFNRLKE